MPSVLEMVKEKITEVPDRYIRSASHLDHDQYHDNSTAINNIPVIDIESLLSGESVLADSELQKLHSACQHWGFFRVANHGISSLLIEKLKSEMHSLFQLSPEEKRKILLEPEQGFGEQSVFSDDQSKLDWSDSFAIGATQPPNSRNTQLFARMPPLLREAVEAYSTDLKNLTMNLLGKMAEGLNMDSNEMKELFKDLSQSMKMIYYPPCPKSQQVIGLSPHSDYDALTIVLQLNETVGLQIRKDGKWVPVKPIPGELVVNVGDMIQILSNGAYRSIEHRVMVNPAMERLSIATFHSIDQDTEFGPAFSLIDPPHKPALFRREIAKKFHRDAHAERVEGKSTSLDFMRIKNVD